MATTTVSKVKRGFTLIEILIVVVILGILAAIVIPQFTDASQEAMESSIKSQLQTIRSQIELYRVKNAGSPPATMFDDLVTGDYLQSAPVNPFNSSTVVSGSAGATVGWIYNSTTGDIFAVYVNGTTAATAGGDDGSDPSNPW